MKKEIQDDIYISINHKQGEVKLDEDVTNLKTKSSRPKNLEYSSDKDMETEINGNDLDKEQLVSVGFELIDKGKFEEALEYIDRFIKENSNDARGYAGKAICLSNLERNEEALHHCKKAFELDPDNKGIREILASVYYTIGDEKNYIKIIKENVKIYPNDIKARYGLSEALLLSNQLNDAEEQLKIAFDILEKKEFIEAEELSMLHQQAGIIYVMKGFKDKAVNEFKKSIKAYKKNHWSIKLLDACIMLDFNGSLLEGNPMERRNRLFGYANWRPDDVAFQHILEEGYYYG